MRGADKRHVLCTVFIGDLASIVTEKHLEILMKQNGLKSTEIKIIRGVKDSTISSLNYGFARFPSHEAAKHCIETLDNVELCGRQLQLGWAGPKVKSKSDGIKYSVHVKFVSTEKGVIVNELTFRESFHQFGILDVIVKESSFSEMNLCQGFGFVEFPVSNIAGAYNCVDYFKINPILNNVRYTCSLSNNFLKQMNTQSNNSKTSHGTSSYIDMPLPVSLASPQNRYKSSGFTAHDNTSHFLQNMSRIGWTPSHYLPYVSTRPQLYCPQHHSNFGDTNTSSGAFVKEQYMKTGGGSDILNQSNAPIYGQLQCSSHQMTSVGYIPHYAHNLGSPGAVTQPWEYLSHSAASLYSTPMTLPHAPRVSHRGTSARCRVSIQSINAMETEI